jgi:cell division protein FtsB
MKNRFSYVALILLVAILSIFAAFSGDGYGRVTELRALLERQQEANQHAQNRLNQLKQEVFSVQHSNRALEKAARNELTLARDDEMIFIFDGQ